MPVEELSPVLSQLLRELGVDFEALLRAWARVAPTLVLVPAFGGVALPVAARAGLGVALALAIAPGLRAATPTSLPLALELLRQVLLGLPVALSAALLVYTALMAGGLIDELRGSRESANLPVFDGTTTPVGALLGLLVVIAFHQMGGPAQLVSALAIDPPQASSIARVVAQLTLSISIAIAAAAPLLVASIVLSVAEALVARAASPAHIAGLLAPLRGVALLAILALALDRVTEFLSSASLTFLR